MMIFKIKPTYPLVVKKKEIMHFECVEFFN